MTFGPGPLPRGVRLGAIAPVPFVGAAAILVALIVFTPVLLATGPSPLAVQAELSFYRASGASATEVYLEGVDPHVAYRWLNLSLGSGFSWSGSCPSSVARWNESNDTNATVVAMFTEANPVVVNVTAVYLPSSGRTVYAGELALYLVGQNTSGEGLLYVPCSWSSGLGPGGSWAISLGTLSVLLVNYGSGGPP